MAVLEAQADPDRAEGMARYHKVPRRYLGLANPVLNDLAKTWRGTTTPAERLSLAEALWASNIHEARILAAKLLTQARIKPDDSQAWDLLKSWVPDFDAWAIADHAAIAGQKRLTADPSRLADLTPWVTAQPIWTRRAALTYTLGFTKSRHPKQAEIDARETVLTWATEIAKDPNWFLQKAVAWWLRDLSKRDALRVTSWLTAHGHHLKPFAQKEAQKHLVPRLQLN